jgi:hypothetical protein
MPTYVNFLDTRSSEVNSVMIAPGLHPFLGGHRSPDNRLVARPIDRNHHGVTSLGSSSCGCCRRCSDRCDGRRDGIVRQRRREGARDVDNDDHHPADHYVSGCAACVTDGEEHQPHRGQPVYPNGVRAAAADSYPRRPLSCSANAGSSAGACRRSSRRGCSCSPRACGLRPCPTTGRSSAVRWRYC